MCPVCSGRLFEVDNTLKCMGGHSFDKARQGYVNLLMKNSARRHGDDKLMLNACRSFLGRGYYALLRDAVAEILGEGNTVLDSGCGEGYYTESFSLKNRVCGIDISKDAVSLAAGRCKNAQFAVASISDIPLKSASVDAVVNIFAPDSNGEFLRILKPHGRLITALPLENHLFELKAAVYAEPYLNPVPETAREGFTLKSSKKLEYMLTLDNNEDIRSLFCMTPYYYKTSEGDQKKLEHLTSLKTKAEFLILEYEKL